MKWQTLSEQAQGRQMPGCAQEAVCKRRASVLADVKAALVLLITLGDALERNDGVLVAGSSRCGLIVSLRSQ